MFFNDAFGLFGHFAFSSKPTHGRSIYQSLVDGMGDAYNTDFNSYQQGRLYAQSICLATAQYQLDRAFNNRNPAKASELLGQLERDFQVTPGPNSTLRDRRNFLAALFEVAKGNSQTEIESALSVLLGSDFVSYDHLPASPWPTSPGSVGVFSASGTPVKQFTINSPVSITGSPITVGFSLNDPNEEGPMAGETYTIDPDPRTTIEQITISSSNSTTITATFSRSHERGAIAIRPYPIWISGRRYSTITVKLSAAKDPEKRRLINELMSRASRAVSQWCVVSDQGNLVLDSSTAGLLGYTTLG